jgi:hypothetical protein
MLTLPGHVEEKVRGELAAFGRDEHELRGHWVGVGGTILPDGSSRGDYFRDEGAMVSLLTRMTHPFSRA